MIEKASPIGFGESQLKLRKQHDQNFLKEEDQLQDKFLSQKIGTNSQGLKYQAGAPVQI